MRLCVIGPLEMPSSPTCVIMPSLVVLGKWYHHKCGDSAGKMGPHAVLIRVTVGHWNRHRSIGYL